ncbi:antitoxin [Rhodohalobacter sp.]|uniref:antitoxin n=1 Tax=Rhodohalobacter sp. TaxID=1974210 RepID=UPI003563B4D9
MDYIDKKEKEITKSCETEDWITSGEKIKEEIRQAAKKSTLKNKRINICLTEKDFKDIQVKAMEEGIPYQTLISSIIHKFNKGELKTDSE